MKSRENQKYKKLQRKTIPITKKRKEIKLGYRLNGIKNIERIYKGCKMNTIILNKVL